MSATALAPVSSKTRSGYFERHGRGRILELDGLRGLAVLSVVLWHFVAQLGPPSDPKTAFGMVRFALGLSWSGVDLFFVLSGFLITGILVDARDSLSYFKTFYARRIHRIFPLYFLLLATVPIVGALQLVKPEYVQEAGVPLLSYAFFAQNLFTSWMHSWGMPWLGSMWSLAVEEHFYLAFPAIVRFVSRRRLLIFLAVCVLAAPVVRFALRSNQVAEYTFTLCRADALAIGALIALLVRDPELWKTAIAMRRWVIAGALSTAPVFAYLLSINHGKGHYSFPFWGYSVLAFFYGATVLIALTSSAQGLLAGSLKTWFLQQAGKLSYSIYMIHASMKQLCESYIATPAYAVLVAAFATVVLSVITYHLVEAPLQRRGQTLYKY